MRAAVTVVFVLSMLEAALVSIAEACGAPSEVSARRHSRGEESAAFRLTSDRPEAGTDRSRTAADWGVEIVGVRLVAAGYMLDFRFRVVDSEKASRLFDRAITPYLIDQATGARMGIPTFKNTGALRSVKPPQVDRTYFIVFGNPGRFIQPGRAVTIVIGDFTAEARVDE